MIRILNELTLQKGIAKFRKNMCFGQNKKSDTTTKQKIKHKHPYQNRVLNAGPLDHRIN